MNDTPRSPFKGARWIVALAVMIQAYRILTVASPDHGETPFLSANDRSRWCTIAALIEDRSFIIDRFLERRDRSGKRRTWYSIDMVRKTDADGTDHYYSSKPPLLSVLYAAVCSPLTVVLNRRLSDDPLVVGRSLLLIVQLLPLAGIWFLFVRWIESHTDDPWARWLSLIFLLFGTFLTTFVNTLNNHLPAALCLMVCIWLMEKLPIGNGLFDRWFPWLLPRSAPAQHPNPDTAEVTPGWWRAFSIGWFAALTVAFELPALAWWTFVVGWLLARCRLSVALWALAGSLPVAIAIATTNYLAFGDLQPAYAHREVLGPRLTTISSSTRRTNPAESKVDDQETLAPSLDELIPGIESARLGTKAPYALRAARRNQTWELSAAPEDDRAASIRFAVVPTNEGWSVHRWNDWYDYPKSYWLPENKRGVDLGEPSPWKYAFHVLIGHHGIFSLTPYWLISLWGAWLILRQPQDSPRWWLAALIAATSLICLAFYLSRPLIDRNYGGVCSGFRWQFWLSLAWFWLALPGLEWLVPSRRGWCFVLVVLAISIFSATYPWANPWQHPWPYRGG